MKLIDVGSDSEVLVEVSNIISEIDLQIQKLQQARDLLAGGDEGVRRGPGRPKGSKTLVASAEPAAPKKRKLSAEGRKRIADAMKRRWAERAKANGKT